MKDQTKTVTVIVGDDGMGREKNRYPGFMNGYSSRWVDGDKTHEERYPLLPCLSPSNKPLEKGEYECVLVWQFKFFDNFINTDATKRDHSEFIEWKNRMPYETRQVYQTVDQTTVQPPMASIEFQNGVVGIVTRIDSPNGSSCVGFGYQTLPISQPLNQHAFIGEPLVRTNENNADTRSATNEEPKLYTEQEVREIVDKALGLAALEAYCYNWQKSAITSTNYEHLLKKP